MRYQMVDGQGNFGSVDGDSPAAMRYTECRLQKIAEEMLVDIDKNTVNFQPNFDESLQEPTVLPTRIPNLLVNGASGIAVGMATNMPPHNLSEIIDATVAYIHNSEITTEELIKYVKAPDFPTGGIIYGYAGVREAFETGRGRIVIRSKVEIETESNGREKIIVTEIPYMGMGEPFDNTLEVLKALEILTAPWGYAWSPRRITVSTIGLIPGMKQFLEHSQCHLAISLHSPFDKERLDLMPAQKAYPIEKVLEVVRQYDFRHQRRVSFEYIVFDRLNDSMRHGSSYCDNEFYPYL